MNRTPSATGTPGTLSSPGTRSTTGSTNSPSATGTLPSPLPAADPRPRFLDLVLSEWVKLRSLRSTWIAYGAAALAVLAFNVGTAYDTAKYWTEEDAADRADFIRDGIPLQLAFNGNAATVMMLALGALGALAIVGEFSTGTIRTTFAAVPARGAVMGAKTVVVAAFATLFGRSSREVRSSSPRRSSPARTSGSRSAIRAPGAWSSPPRCSPRCARSPGWPSAPSSATPRPR